MLRCDVEAWSVKEIGTVHFTRYSAGVSRVARSLLSPASSLLPVPRRISLAPRRLLYLGRVWFGAYGATPHHTSCAAGVAAESAAAG